MESQRKCLGCKAELPADAPAGHCPNCLLALGFDQGTIATHATQSDSTAPPAVNANSGLHSFGDYELLEEIARGGMGIVYKARQKSLNRMVAVKMILTGHFAGKEDVLRFRGEAEAAANLRHPNIVAVFETGECEGQPYFSMEYVPGRSLAEIVREGPLPAKRAAQYAKTIAEAIHYAHSQGILHRDLKPSNVLIDIDDQPRVTDFGLAKQLRGDAGLTVSGQVLGSPNFMPPEQAGNRGSRREEALASNSAIRNPQSAIEQSLVTSAATETKVGPPSDVYGIGAILYCLLTGRPPFQAETIQEVLVQLQEREPVALHLLIPNIPRDLETITLKCLEKDPARRYATAQQLADELTRFLAGQPIQARPLGAPERTWRWCRRKPALAGALAAMLVVFALGFAGVLWQSAGRRKALAETKHALIESRRTLYAAQMHLVQQSWNEGDVEGAQTLLKAQIPKPGEEDVRGFEWRHLWQACRDESAITIEADRPNDVQSVAISPDGAMLAFGGLGHLRAWRFDTGNLLPRFKQPPGYVRSLVFLPDGSRIACGNQDGDVRFWDVHRGELLAEIKDVTGPIECVRVSHDGRLLAAVERLTGTVRIFNLATLREVTAIPGPRHDRPALAFSPDGKTFAFSRGDHAVVLWDLDGMTEIRRLLGVTGLIVCLEFSPDGRLLAGAGTDGLVRLWDVTSPREPEVLKGHKTTVSSVTFSPDGSRLATSCSDGTIKLWDLASRSELRMLRGHKRWVNNVVFTPDGTKLISSSDDQTVKVWNLEEAVGRAGLSAEADTMPTSKGIVPVAPTIFSPDGKLLVTGNREKEIVLWDVATEHPIDKLSGHTATVNNAAFSPDGQLLASVSDDQTVRVWNVKERKEIAAFNGHTAPVLVATFSGDGRLLASAGEDKAVRLWDLATGKPVATFVGHTTNVFQLSFTPNGRTLLSADNHECRGWDVRRHEQVFQLRKGQ